MSCAGKRWSAEGYLTHWRPSLFPPYFTDVLHPFFARVVDADVDARVRMLQDAFPRIRSSIIANDHSGGGGGERVESRAAGDGSSRVLREGSAAKVGGEGLGPELGEAVPGAGDDFRVSVHEC